MDDNNFNNFAWSMFAQSGQLGYYMMYKALQDDEKTEMDEKLR